MTTAVFDIETNEGNFLAYNWDESITTVYCIVIYSIDDKKLFKYSGDAVEKGVRHLEQFETVVGHNIIKFDIPVLQRMFNFKLNKCRDTYITSLLIYPTVEGGHSLKAWGERLGEAKLEFKEFKEYTPEMLVYCAQDVKVTFKLDQFLMSKQPSITAMDIEHNIAWILNQQTRTGFKFDVEKANELVILLTTKHERLTQRLNKEFGSWYEKIDEVIPKIDRAPFVKGVPYTKVKLVEFNSNSRLHIVKRLRDKYGWVPKVFTEKGNVKIDESILKTIDLPPAKLLSEAFLIQKRLGQLFEGNQAWLKSVEDDGRIHGRITQNGTITGRMCHYSPNMAQIPAVRSEFGKECRELFTVEKGNVLVGVDASSLELRCLVGYLAPFDGGESVENLLNGEDAHQKNADILGCTREQAKTWLYAYIYGAGDDKLGVILGHKRGKETRERFMNSFPALKQLTDKLKNKVKTTGCIKGLDGRIIKCDKEHVALNYLLQSAGSVIMKKALEIANNRLIKNVGKDFKFVANVHDEWQIETKECYAGIVGGICGEAIEQAGIELNFPCPMEGKYKVGKTWFDTH